MFCMFNQLRSLLLIPITLIIALSAPGAGLHRDGKKKARTNKKHHAATVATTLIR